MTANPNYVATFTVGDLINEVLVLANEMPDYVYLAPEDEDDEEFVEGCSYLRSHDDATKGCIMGQAMRRLGVPDDVLLEHEGQTIVRVLETLGVVDGPMGGDPSTWGTGERWLFDVQQRQDTGEAWGAAVRHASLLTTTTVITGSVN
jgi:hypothetical protein